MNVPKQPEDWDGRRCYGCGWTDPAGSRGDSELSAVSAHVTRCGVLHPIVATGNGGGTVGAGGGWPGQIATLAPVESKPTIIDSIGTWPYPKVNELRHEGSKDWIEISEDHADQFLGSVPPIYIAGGFMVSEAADHDFSDGMPVYLTVITVAGRHFAKELRSDVARKEGRQLLLEALRGD